MAFPDPVLDHRVTSRRATWSEVPAELVRVLGDSLDSSVIGADAPVTMGFTPAFAGRVHLADGRTVFVKAAQAEGFSGAAIARERLVLAALAGMAPAPRLLGAATAAGWEAEALELLDGHSPALPTWTPADVGLVHEALLRFAHVRAGDIPADLVDGSVVESLCEDETNLDMARALTAGSWTPPDWLPHPEHLPEVGGLALRSAPLLGGDAVRHGDLRPDNLLVVGDRAVLVDWNWLERGPAWGDLVGLLPRMHADGIDVDALVARSPLTQGADPEAIDAYLAIIAVFMLARMTLPPFPGGLLVVRAHQAVQARDLLALLGHRRGW